MVLLHRALIALTFALVAAGAAAPAAGARDYIVGYRAAAGPVDRETAQRERAEGFESTYRYRRALEGFAADLTEGQVRKLRADPEVAYVVPDRPVQALELVPLADGDLAPTGIRRLGAATTTTVQEAANSAVAVIDTGVDLASSDLDAVDGTNCITPDDPAQDDNGHGTHVAGTIGALNNGAGVAGVAPGTRIYAVKVLGADGSGTTSSVICGIDWVTANAAALDIKVANMSLGGLAPVGTCQNDPERAAICASTAAGVSYVVAAGNDGWDLGDEPPDVPAAYPEVLTVTALSDSDGAPGADGPVPCRAGESDDTFATFSNYATRAADIAHMVAAPGVCIRSTRLGGSTSVKSGTSMASPHAAGVVALCLGSGGDPGPCAGLSTAQIIAKVRADAAAQGADFGFDGDPLNPFGSRYYGYAAGLSIDGVVPPPDPDPTPAPDSPPPSSTESPPPADPSPPPASDPDPPSDPEPGTTPAPAPSPSPPPSAVPRPPTTIPATGDTRRCAAWRVRLASAKRSVARARSALVRARRSSSARRASAERSLRSARAKVAKARRGVARWC